MNRFIPLILAFAAPWTTSFAQAPTPLIQSEPHIEVARWMTEQPDPEMRAVGLMSLTGMGQPAPAIESAQFLAGVEELLDEETTGTVPFLLAQGCSRLGILDACAEAGVPEAVRERDGGNPLAAGLFHERNSEEFREVLLEAERVDDHFPDTVAVWFNAMQSDSASEARGGYELVTAFGISMATALPTIAPMGERCRDAVGSDEALDEACQRLSAEMRESGRTLLVRGVGYGMARNRAEQMGSEERAAELREENNALQAPSRCLSDAGHAALESDIETQRHYLQVLQTQGEIAGMNWLIEEFGSSCEDGTA